MQLPLRPAIDDSLMNFVGSFGRGVKRSVMVYVYDRLIRSAYLKYKILGRPVGGLKWIFFLPASTRAQFLNVPAKMMLDAKASQADHIICA